jgi:hypothetical protein
MTVLNQNLDVRRNRIQITRVSENGINYVSPILFKEKLGYTKCGIVRVLELLGVSCVYIGPTRFFDETMANIAVDAWIDKPKYLKIGMSIEFEKIRNAKKDETTAE